MTATKKAVKLNKNAKAWLKALRSGKYKKSKDRLRNANGFCCLGVACDLYGKQNNIEWDEDFHFMNQKNYLPPKVAEWLGLQVGEERQYKLGVLNDEMGYSFSRIADHIEKRKDVLFVGA